MLVRLLIETLYFTVWLGNENIRKAPGDLVKPQADIVSSIQSHKQNFSAPTSKICFTLMCVIEDNMLKIVSVSF